MNIDRCMEHGFVSKDRQQWGSICWLMKACHLTSSTFIHVFKDLVSWSSYRKTTTLHMHKDATILWKEVPIFYFLRKKKEISIAWEDKLEFTRHRLKCILIKDHLCSAPMTFVIRGLKPTTLFNEIFHLFSHGFLKRMCDWEHLHRWLGSVRQWWKPRGLAGVAATAQAWPFTAYTFPMLIPCCDPFFTPNEKDFGIYMVFERFSHRFSRNWLSHISSSWKDNV